MGMDPTVVTIISSVTFVIVGSLAFNVAAILSGFSIYRELSSDHARLITIAVGGVLFVLSPLGYLIFYPHLFVKADATQYYSSELWGLVWSWDALLPFTFAFVGLGLVYGSFSTIQIRKISLETLRTLIDVPFPISSYDLTGDEFLRSIKRRAHITITTPEHLIHGRLMTRSKGSEKEEIELHDCAVYTHDDTHAAYGAHEMPQVPALATPRRMLLKGSQIRAICIPRNASKRHESREDYLVRGYYLSVAGLGFLLLAISSHITGAFVEAIRAAQISSSTGLTEAAHAFHKMPFFYSCWNAMFYVAMVVTLLFAVYSPVNEFNQKRKWTNLMAAYTINVNFLILLTCVAVFATLSGCFMIWNDIELSRGVSMYLYNAIIIMGCVVVLSLVIGCAILLICETRKWRREIKTTFCEVIRSFEDRDTPDHIPGVEQLAYILDYLRQHIDVNAEDNSYRMLQDSLNAKGYAWADLNHRLFTPLEKIVGTQGGCHARPRTNSPLEGEEYNVIAAFQRFLERRQQTPHAAKEATSERIVPFQ